MFPFLRLWEAHNIEATAEVFPEPNITLPRIVEYE